MSDSSSLHENEEIICDGEHSQESGLGTLLVNDGSVDSLEELTENVHQQLNAHFDHMGLIRYENERLRAQLNDKDRIITAQQTTVKKLQDAVSSSYGELMNVRRNSEAELNSKSETIRSLQCELVDCQKQYADCFQQVVNQDRQLAEIREEDKVMFEKMSLLENHFSKTVKSRDMSTQTVESRDMTTQTERIAQSESIVNQESYLNRWGNERFDGFKELWNVLTEERQQRSNLEHSIRQMETELIDMKNQVQNCNANLQLQAKDCLCIYESPCYCHVITPRSSSCLVTLV